MQHSVSWSFSINNGKRHPQKFIQPTSNLTGTCGTATPEVRILQPTPLRQHVEVASDTWPRKISVTVLTWSILMQKKKTLYTSGKTGLSPTRPVFSRTSPSSGCDLSSVRWVVTHRYGVSSVNICSSLQIRRLPAYIWLCDGLHVRFVVIRSERA